MNTSHQAENTGRAVSPVIGIILMVAITVILAAVIGAFVLSLGSQVSTTPPQASFEFDFDQKTNVTITHIGGNDLDNETLTVTMDGLELYPEPDSGANITNDGGWDKPIISTGDSLDVFNETSGEAIADGGESIRIIWSEPKGGSSNTLGEKTWPN